MVESLKELNQKVQKPRYKEVGNWMVRHFERDAALYITWALLHTKITANQVTFLSIMIGLLSALVFMIPTPAGFFWGAVILQLWYLFDHVDGQVARYRGTSSITGIYFDYITHYVVHSSVFLGISAAAFLKQGNPLFIFLGAVAALFMAFVSMFFDAKYKALYAWLEKGKHSINWEAGSGDFRRSETADKVATTNPLKKVFVFLYKLTEIHIVLNILTVLGIAGLWLNEFPFAEIVTVFYALLLPFIFTARVFYTIKNQQLDREYKELVKENV